MKTNFIHVINKFIYLNAKAVRFFRRNILPRKTVLAFLRLLFISVQNDYNNLIILFNLSTKNFVTTFRYLGNSFYNFLIILSKMCFDKKYYFSNFVFISGCIKRTFSFYKPISKRFEKEQRDLTSKELNSSFPNENKEKEKFLRELIDNQKCFENYLGNLTDCLPYVCYFIMPFREIIIEIFIIRLKYLRYCNSRLICLTSIMNLF